MDSFWHDVRYSLRLLARTPGFTAVAALTLALGIGANTAIFSVVHAVLLRPLPYADAGRLVRVSEERPGRIGPPRQGAFMTGDTLQAWREGTATIEGPAAYGSRAYTLTGLDEPIRLRGAAVSPAMFAILRVTPAAGRLFRAEEEAPGSARVAMLSHGLWRNRFGGDAATVGRTIALDGNPHTVVGVLPRDFQFPDKETEIWTPFVLRPVVLGPNERFVIAFAAIARLKPGVALARAEAEGNTVFQRVQQEMRVSDPQAPEARGGSLRLVPLQAELTAAVRPALLVLWAAVGFVLLIAAANLANLLLARGTLRQRELAIRAAVGADRARLVRQLMTESVLLGLIGGGLGLAAAYGLARALPAVAPANIPRMDEVGIDGQVLGFALLVSIVTGLLFGLVPAAQGSRLNLVQALSEGSGTHAAGGFRPWRGNRARSALVVAEIALALVLLVGAGLLAKSFLRLIDVDPGYDPRNVLTAQVTLPRAKYGRGGAQAAFYDALFERVRGLPGVEAAGMAHMLPLLPGNIVLSFRIDGRPPATTAEDAPRAGLRVVSPGYLQAMGLRLARGRWLSERDAGAPPVCVVNEVFARRYLADVDPIGQRLRLTDDLPSEIVGVVGDVRHMGLDADPQPELYVSYRQSVGPGPNFFQGPATTIVVRTAGDPLAIVPALRTAVRALDPDLPLDGVRTMADRLSASVAGPRFYALLLGLFAALALGLAAVGIYGVLAYLVSQRRREIGVRIALGARRADILKLVLGRGALLASLGIVAGLVAARLVSRVLTGQLFGVSTTDPATYAAIALLLGAVALAACYVPARRAMRVDPIEALRYE